MVFTGEPEQNNWPKTPMFRVFSSSSISLKTSLFVTSATITFTFFPVVSSGEKGEGGTSISSCWSLQSCVVTQYFEFFFFFFTYFFSHHVQICSASAYDDHIHSMLSELRVEEVQQRWRERLCGKKYSIHTLYTTFLFDRIKMILKEMPDLSWCVML